MIEIWITNTNISVKGHAEFAEYDKNIVCAAVSVLTMNLIDSVNSLTKDKLSYNIRDGDVEISFLNLSAGTKLLIDSFFIGISRIATNYPEHVRIL